MAAVWNNWCLVATQIKREDAGYGAIRSTSLSVTIYSVGKVTTMQQDLPTILILSGGDDCHLGRI